MSHRYKVGQEVSYSPGKLTIAKSAGRYKVVRHMPLENGQYTYRIKSLSELFERVASEGEISRPGQSI